MRAGRAGDAVAYARALRGLAPLLRGRVLRKLWQAADEAEDVVQEVLLAIHLRNASWDERLPLLPWAMAIADHKAIDALRKRGRAARLVSDRVAADDLAELVAAPAPEHDTAGLDLERELDGLPARQREVVRAMALEGGTIAAVAVRFGMQEGAVRVALHRGLKALASAARAENEAPPSREGRTP